MAKPKPKKTSPRLVRRGDIVQLKGQDGDEVVRDVQFVLLLANGNSEVYTADEMVTVIGQEELPAGVEEADG